MYRAFFKRLLDICGAIFLIVLTLPIMAVVAVLIYFKVSKGVIFTQARPGLHAKIFKIYKFKTMSDERGADGELLPDELRLSGVGKTIRSLSLDELPQLFNVLRLEMSLVGPRPYMFYEKKQIGKNLGKITRVRPGLTGLWQVSGRNEIPFDERVKMECAYVDNLSIFRDFLILVRTIFVVLK